MSSIHDLRFQRLKDQVIADLQLMIASCDAGVNDPLQKYVLSQSAKYLKPVKVELIRLRLERLLAAFQGGGNPPPHWSFTGLEMSRYKTGDQEGKVNPSLLMAFAHADIDGGGNIRIQQRAWALPDKQLAGIMLHEVTHVVFSTEDHRYMFRLKQLDAETRWDNADNWRIFYQKVRSYIRKESINTLDTVD